MFHKLFEVSFWLIIEKCRRWEFRLCAELGQLAWGLGKPLFSFGFVTFSGAPPVIPLAVGGGRGRRQRRDADVGNGKIVCFIRFHKVLKLFGLIIWKCRRWEIRACGRPPERLCFINVLSDFPVAPSPHSYRLHLMAKGLEF